MQLQFESNLTKNDKTIVSLPAREGGVTKISSKHSCMACIHKSHCLAQGLDSDGIAKFDSAVNHSRRVNPGAHLYRMGDAAKAVFTVLSGSVKSYALAENGREHIVGFYLPGELMAIDAIGTQIHSLSAVALEKTVVCEIPMRLFDDDRSDRIPHLQNGLLRQISTRLRTEQQHAILLGQKSAEQRLAMFLVDLSNRLGFRGYASLDFLLSMSRGEIGNYLGLAMETVSRTFTRFQDLGLITVERKRIIVRQMEQLEFLAKNGEDFECSAKILDFCQVSGKRH